MKKQYFWSGLFFLAITFYIGFYGTGFVRAYLGDVVIVMVLYFFLRTIWKTSMLNAALSILLFAFALEFAQYFHLVDLLGLGDNRLASIIIGTSFSWLDLIAYSVGILLAMGWDIILQRFFTRPTLQN